MEKQKVKEAKEAREQRTRDRYDLTGSKRREKGNEDAEIILASGRVQGKACKGKERKSKGKRDGWWMLDGSW